MSRIRSVKPAFFVDEDLGALVPLDRLLFAGLWCEADREGRLEDRPQYLKAMYLPYDKCNVDQMLCRLAQPKPVRGGDAFIHRYEVNGKRYIHVVTFKEHQRPHHTEAASELPECLICSGLQPLTVNSPLNDGEVPDGKEGKGREQERKGKEGKGKSAAASSPEFLAEMIAHFPALDVPWEFQKCADWWRDRKNKDPSKLALRNWLEKAVKIKADQKAGSNGEARKYHKGPPADAGSDYYGPELIRMPEQDIRRKPV